MRATEILTSVAEISIALAGFTGIVVAFRQRGIDSFLPHELVRLRFLLQVACLLLCFALFPFVPYYLDLPETRAWSVSSGALAVSLLTLAVVTFVQARPHLDRLSFAWFITYIAGSVVVSGVQFANSNGFAGSSTAGLYLAGLGWLLFYSTSLFVRLILRQTPSG